VLAESLDPTQTLRRLAELAVTRVADWCAVDLLEGESIENVVVAHQDPERVVLATELRRRYPPDPRARTGLANVLRTGRSEVYSELSDEMLVEAAKDEEHLELMRALDLRAAMVVPLRARGRTLGGLTFVSSSPDRAYTEDDLAFAEDLARRAALALDNARHYRHEREVAISLQESLLPQSIPDLPGAEVATRYLSGTRGVEVGGDWYDVFASGDDAISLVMGDVAGRGVAAASVMGQLRTAIRSYELEGHRPAAIVSRVNRLAHSLTEAVLATLVYVRIDHSAGSLTIVNAGHPPVLMRRADGSADFLTAEASEPISVLPESPYEESTCAIEPGSTLVLYTDGLIERRGERIDVGLERLRQAVADGPKAPGELAEHVLGSLLSGSERPDDVAILVASLHHSGERAG
jgi:serine phosphatase RsbU (regulator of sigma subunit)